MPAGAPLLWPRRTAGDALRVAYLVAPGAQIDIGGVAIEVEGYFLPYEKPPTKPTVLDVLGPHYHHRAAEVYIDNEVLEQEQVEEKDEILRQGEEEKRKRREEMASVHRAV